MGGAKELFARTSAVVMGSACPTMRSATRSTWPPPTKILAERLVPLSRSTTMTFPRSSLTRTNSTSASAIVGTRDMTARSFFTIPFTDLYNGIYTTRPIDAGRKALSVANDIENSLLDLPNRVIPSIVVEGKDITGGVEIPVDFVDSATSGRQNLLECSTVTSMQMCDGGAIPMYKSAGNVTCTVTDVNGDGNLKENLVCGNRGICNSATGSCKCFQGHTGERCDEKTVFF